MHNMMIRCKNCGLKVPVEIPDHIPEEQHPAYIKELAVKETKECAEERTYTEKEKMIRWKSNS